MPTRTSKKSLQEENENACSSSLRFGGGEKSMEGSENDLEVL